MTVFLLPGARASAPMTPDVLGILRRAGVVLASRRVLSVLEPWSRGVLQTWTLESGRRLVSRLSEASSPQCIVLAPGPDVPEGVVDQLVAALKQRGEAVRVLPDEAGSHLYAGDRVPFDRVEAWAAHRPLLGWSVVVTRAEPQGEPMMKSLRERGAEAIAFPVIRIQEASDPAPLANALSSLERYEWILFTSANGVRAFADRLAADEMDARALAGIRVGAIGPATAGALAHIGIRADVVPREFVAESLLEALEAAGGWSGKRVLLPRAREARDLLPDGLAELGAAVDVVEAYRTEPVGAAAGPDMRTSLERGEVDLVTFTASSTVRAFHDAVGTLGRARAVAIGPVTARTIEEVGLPLAAVAKEYTTAGLVEACVTLAREEAG